MMQPDEKAPLLDHLIELRQRLLHAVLSILAGFILCYAFSEELFIFLVHPLREIIGPNAKMIYTGLHEAFFTYLKLAFFGGLFLSSPLVLGQLWLFVAPGLYQHEKRAMMPFLILTPLLFFAGGAFAYAFVFPVVFKFFLTFTSDTIEALPTLREYLGLVMKLMFAFGLAFEIPVALLLLVRVGLVSTATLVHKRRFAIVLAFILGAILTPPDPITQVMLAVPIMGLYELSILGGRLIERGRAKQAQQEHEDQADP
jgi:sec-independent protein translocase protein TatC